MRLAKAFVHLQLTAVLLLVSFTSVHSQVSATKYDYSAVATHIAGDCTTKVSQAEAIYRWMCQHIAYDTEHKIHTADECWDERKGVCQAYCELYYRLAEPLGLHCTMIPGVTKDSKGNISDDGHAWLLVEVEEGGILVDPTWGAGGVQNGVFVRSDDDRSWFDVDSYWLIFTHYPDDSTFQFVETPISKETFAQLPYLKPSLGIYGWEGKAIYESYLQGEITSLPRLYTMHATDLHIKDIPLQSELIPGQYYTFKIAKRTDSIMALAHDGELVCEDSWRVEDSCYVIDYMPVNAGTLRVVVACGNNDYSTAIEYTVAAPTPQATAQIRHADPYRLPEIKALDNLHPELFVALGISGEELLDEVEQNGLTAVFSLNKDVTLMLREVDIPLSQYLKVGQTYRFAIRPNASSRWAIFNEGAYYNTWTVDEATGWHTIEVTPTNPGRLSVSVGLPPDMQKYRAMLSYTVLQ